MAAVTMASRLMGSRRRRAGRSGARCQGGGGICGSPEGTASGEAAAPGAAGAVWAAGFFGIGTSLARLSLTLYQTRTVFDSNDGP